MEEVFCCDVCGSEDNIQCEIYLNGDEIGRVYHFCPECQSELYMICIDELLGGNEYKVNQFVQNQADALINRSITDGKLTDINPDDIFDKLNPIRVRKVKPYNNEGCDCE